MTHLTLARWPSRLLSSCQLIRAFECTESPETASVLHLAQRLARQHLEQWAVEDDCRDRAGDHHAVAAAKHEIDRLNAARVSVVEAIDAWSAKHLVAPPSAPLHTETLGSVIDRLAVAWVRARRFEERPARSAAREEREVANCALLQLEELGCAFDCLVGEVQAGSRRLPNWLPLKRYGSLR